MSDITKERWSRFNNEVVSGQGETVTVDAGTSSREDEVLAAIAVLPEALAELLASAQYDHDGPCWGMAPCAIGNHHESCMRKRDVLRRAGVLP